MCRSDEIEETFWLYRGLPQGSVLSPVLYSLYVIDLDRINSLDCRLIQYAGDVGISSSASPLERDLSVMESAISETVVILEGLGLSLAAEKTKLCVFNREDRALKVPMIRQEIKTFRRRAVSINVQGIEVFNSAEVRFLGMNFQSNLSWKAHISRVKQRCECPIKMIKCLGHVWWGADPRLLIMIYRALVRSRLEYGGFLLQNLKKNLSSQLDKVQLRALRAVVGYRQSTPMNVVLCEAFPFY